MSLIDEYRRSRLGELIDQGNTRIAASDTHISQQKANMVANLNLTKSMIQTESAQLTLTAGEQTEVDDSIAAIDAKITELQA